MTELQQEAMEDECRLAFEVLGCKDWGALM